MIFEKNPSLGDEVKAVWCGYGVCTHPHEGDIPMHSAWFWRVLRCWAPRCSGPSCRHLIHPLYIHRDRKECILGRFHYNSSRQGHHLSISSVHVSLFKQYHHIIQLNYSFNVGISWIYAQNLFGFHSLNSNFSAMLSSVGSTHFFRKILVQLWEIKSYAKQWIVGWSQLFCVNLTSAGWTQLFGKKLTSAGWTQLFSAFGLQPAEVKFFKKSRLQPAEVKKNFLQISAFFLIFLRFDFSRLKSTFFSTSSDDTRLTGSRLFVGFNTTG